MNNANVKPSKEAIDGTWQDLPNLVRFLIKKDSAFARAELLAIDLKIKSPKKKLSKIKELSRDKNCDH